MGGPDDAAEPDEQTRFSARRAGPDPAPADATGLAPRTAPSEPTAPDHAELFDRTVLSRRDARAAMSRPGTREASAPRRSRPVAPAPEPESPPAVYRPRQAAHDGASEPSDEGVPPRRSPAAGTATDPALVRVRRRRSRIRTLLAVILIGLAVVAAAVVLLVALLAS